MRKRFLIMRRRFLNRAVADVPLDVGALEEYCFVRRGGLATGRTSNEPPSGAPGTRSEINDSGRVRMSRIGRVPVFVTRETINVT